MLFTFELEDLDMRHLLELSDAHQKWHENIPEGHRIDVEIDVPYTLRALIRNAYTLGGNPIWAMAGNGKK